MTVTTERSMRWAMTIAVLVSAVSLTAEGPRQSPTAPASSPGTIVLNANVRGNESPLGGSWEWTGKTVGANGKQYEATLKVKFKGGGLTGTWSDTDKSRKVDRAFSSKGIADGVIVNTNTFTFKRCYITISTSKPEWSYELLDRFIECTPYQPNMTVIHYAGTITGNQLIVTTTTKSNQRN